MFEADQRRSLGLTTATFLVVANMIGAGVFTTSGYSLADLGSPRLVLLAWVIGGVFAACGALSYGALARRIPESGGEYIFLTRAFHPFVGFLAGWVSLLAGFTAPIAFAAMAMQRYLSTSFGWGWDERWVGTLAIAVAGVLHGFRLRPGVFAQNGAVAIKLLLLVVFLVLGVIAIRDVDAVPPVTAEPFELGAFAVTLVWISLAYSGWNAAVYIASEVRDPKVNLPRALLLGTGLVTLLYLGLNAIFVYSAPVEELAGKAEVGAVAAEALGGLGLRRLVAVLVSMALFTSVSSMVMAGPRVYARMAEDGLFPRIFRMGKEVPGWAVDLQAVLAILVVWSSDLRQLLSYLGFTLGLSAAATVCGLVRLRIREGADRVPVPGYPVVPAVFVLGTLFSAVYFAQLQPREAFLGFATVASGALLYGIRSLLRRRRVLG